MGTGNIITPATRFPAAASKNPIYPLKLYLIAYLIMFIACQKLELRIHDKQYFADQDKVWVWFLTQK